MDDERLNRHRNNELGLLSDAVKQHYDCDLSGYSHRFLHQQVTNQMGLLNVANITDFIPIILNDKTKLELLLSSLSVTVTEMFRDPAVFKVLRKEVLPMFESYPKINVWNAGCATGEESYSLAILLDEVGLLDRARIYATDFNQRSLDIARNGIYSKARIMDYEKSYLASGGEKSLFNYCRVAYDAARFEERLKKQITFAYHNLLQDKKFCDMHLILCRNVIIYFNKTATDSLLNLFCNSLLNRGYLVLGESESLTLSSVSSEFDRVVGASKTFRKKLQLVQS